MSEINTENNLKTFPQWLIIVSILSGISGLLLTIGLFTDFSWNSIWVNLIFPPTVGILGLVCFKASKPIAKTKRQKWYRGICCLPAMICGLPYFVVMIGAIFPPFILATGFWVTEEADRSIVQKSVSPDGSVVALVSYKPSGAYTSGLGSTELQLTYPNFPLVKRDLHKMGKTDSDTNRTNWIKWIDNNNIYIIDNQKTIEVGVVKFEIPQVLFVIFLGIAMLARLVVYVFTGS